MHTLDEKPVPKGQSADAKAPDGARATLFSDVVVAVLCGLVAVPLCEASWHAIVTTGEYLRGVIGLLFGMPIGVAGFTFHWWKNRFDKFGDTVVYWWPLVILLSFLYVVVPEMYRKSTAPADPAGMDFPTPGAKDEGPAEISTSLRLQFDANGTARQIDQRNIKNWRLTSQEEATLSPGYNAPCDDQYVRKSTGTTAALSAGASFCLIKTKTWIVLLAYERPTLFKYISLNAHGAALPNWNNAGSTNISAAIWIHGKLENVILDVTLVN